MCPKGLLIGKLFRSAASYERPSTARKRRAREQKESQERLERIQAPKVLGPRLTGSLTIGKKELAKTEVSYHRDYPILKKITHDQLQSPLFRLPLEVRRQIYEETIGGYIIHIYCLEAYKRMNHVRCKTPKHEACSCRRMYKQKGIPDSFGNIDLLAPMKSCRRMLVTLSSGELLR